MNITPGWALVLSLLLLGLATYLVVNEIVRPIVDDIRLFLARRRVERNAWKRRPHIPQQRGPQGMTRGARQLYMATYQVPAPAPTEVRKDVA